MRITNLERNIITLIYMLEAGCIIAQMTLNDTIASVMLYASFVVVLFLWIYVMSRGKINKGDFLAFFIISLSFVFVLWNATLDNAMFTFAYVKKMIMFWATIVFFQTASKLSIDKKLENRIKNIIIVVTFIIIAMFLFADSSFIYEHKGRVGEYLTLQLSNPNLTAMFLTCIAIFVLSRFWCEKKIRNKIGYLCLFLVIGYMVVKTGSRNSILALVLTVLILCFLAFRRKDLWTTSKFVAFCVTVFPFVFSILYLWLIESDFKNIFEMFSILDKESGTRVDVWTFALQNWKESPWLGAYSQISYGKGASQMHNTHLDILASYGIIVFVLTMFWLYYLIWNSGKSYSKHRVLYHIGFIGIILLGMGEAAIFTGGIGIYIFGGMFIFLRNVYEEDQSTDLKTKL